MSHDLLPPFPAAHTATAESFWDSEPARPVLSLVRPVDATTPPDACSAAVESDTRKSAVPAVAIRHDPLSDPMAEAYKLAFPTYPPVAQPATPVLTDAERKHVAGLQARAALAGYALAPMPGGDFVVERWGMTRALVNSEAVEAFLRQVGAPG